MLTEIDITRFVVKVNGVPVCGPQVSRMLAEQVIARLPVDQQQLAEIVVVSNDNKELLLG